MLYDSETDRPLFKPLVYNDQKRNRPNNVNVYAHLYGMKDIKSRKIENKLEMEKIEHMKLFAKSSENSNKVLEEVQNGKLEVVFEFFDMDGDGFVTNSDILQAADELTPDMLELMSQL